MDTMLSIWLFVFWTVAAPLLWLLLDRLQTLKTVHPSNDGAMQLRAATPRLA